MLMIVKTPGQLSRYRWSGHGYIMGKLKNEWQEVEEVLCHFSNKKREGIKRYENFIKDGWGMKSRNDLEGGGLLRSVGGLSGIRELRKLKEKWQYDSRILGDGDFVGEMLKDADEKWEQQVKLLSKGWNLEKLSKRVEEEFKLEKGEILSGRRYRYLTLPKGVFCFLGSELLGYSLEDIGRYLRISKQAVFKAKGEKYTQNNNKLIS